MEKIKLAVAPRAEMTPRALRREGQVPATLYGPGQASESVQIDAREFGRLPAAAYSHMIDLDFGSKKTVSAVIRNVQRVNVTAAVTHVEFYRVSLDRKLTMSVPLKFINSSPAVAAGGQLQENFQEAEIETLPGDIPDFIEVDLSKIVEIEGAIHFSDLKVSDKVKILNPHDEIVAKVVAPREKAAAEEAPAAAPAAAEAAPAAAEGEAAAES